MTRHSTIAAGLLGLSLFAGAATAGEAGAAGDASHTPQHQLQWAETNIGLLLSPVWGGEGGAHVTMIRFGAGMVAPLHTHEHDYSGIVIAGTTRHYVPGRPETETLLPAGSHWFIPGGLPHVSECLPGADCVMAIHQTGPFGVAFVE